MKNLICVVCVLLLSISCSSSKKNLNDTKTKDTASESRDTITIEDKETAFRVIIFDPRFNGWLAAYAKPRGYYSQNYLEERNRLFVIEWNIRAGQPQNYDPNLYSISIDYDSQEDYGYEVNYLLYNYFIFFQITYNQRLSGFNPRP